MNAAEGLNVIEKLEISENWRALFMWFVFTEKCYLLCGIFTSSNQSTHVSAMIVVTMFYCFETQSKDFGSLLFFF
jgi:hypothetical protein